MPRSIRGTEPYRNKLLKLIPSEIVATYMTIQGLLASGIVIGQRDITRPVAWIVFGILFVLTPVYLRKIHGVLPNAQLAFTALSFAVWVYWLGGPFAIEGWHHAQLASIVLALWTLLIPMAVPSEQPA